MSLQLSTEIRIKVSSQEIWQELIDFNSYPSWNPFITKIEGIPKQHNQLKASIGGMKFKPIVLESTPNKKLVWLGKLLFKGFFDGKHSFEIIEEVNKCVFIQSETFTGILDPLFKKKLKTDTKQGFEAMNEALKLRVESKKSL
ncbi:SRPBCC domain-containing protein [Flavobacteriales bacterium]|nr:SRPBCC domain-containing protein [Flavobacteriales bacterium]